MVQLSLEREHGHAIRCMSLAGESITVVEGVSDAAGLSESLREKLQLEQQSGIENFRALLPNGNLLRDQEDETPIPELFGF